MTAMALEENPRETVEALGRSARELGELLDDSRLAIEALGRDFEALAQRTDAVLALAGALVGSEGCGQALTVLPGVQELGTAARRFIHERLEGTSRILETVTGEAKLLGRLSQLTRGQRAIVRETEMLRVLTNIEVARLGEVGAGFEYLAHELDEFAQSVARSLGELAQHTEERKASIEETKSTLLRDLPRIRDCLEGIARIAAREIGGLGTVVLAEERELAEQLTHIEQMERESLSGNQRLQASLGGVAELMQLVADHLARSKVVRDRLRLLMFNSIVEASHLGSQADGILEISTSIKRISAAWSALTEESEEAMREILALVEQSRSTLETFSEAGSAGLREAQAETRRGLRTLQASAQAADEQGRAIQLATEELHVGIAEIGMGAERLEACFGRLSATVDALERTKSELEGPGRADAAEVERIFAASYTTETERAVLRAALGVAPMPVAQGAFAGNSVELF